MALSHYSWLGLRTQCNWGSLRKSREGGLSTVIGRLSIVAKAHELLFHDLAYARRIHSFQVGICFGTKTLHFSPGMCAATLVNLDHKP